MSELTKDQVLPEKSYAINRELLVAYANASGDHNPIHQDEAFAKSVGLPDVIAHGMLTWRLQESIYQIFQDQRKWLSFQRDLSSPSSSQHA